MMFRAFQQMRSFLKILRDNGEGTGWQLGNDSAVFSMFGIGAVLYIPIIILQLIYTIISYPIKLVWSLIIFIGTRIAYFYMANQMQAWIVTGIFFLLTSSLFFYIPEVTFLKSIYDKLDTNVDKYFSIAKDYVLSHGSIIWEKISGYFGD
jgi:hypothetical protein